MIKLSVFYPNEAGKKFDFTYYIEKHVPLVTNSLGDAILKAEIVQGIGGAEPGSPPLYIVIGDTYYDSIETFQNAFGPHAEKIMADVPNFTDITPVIQLSEVK